MHLCRPAPQTPPGRHCTGAGERVRSKHPRAGLHHPRPGRKWVTDVTQFTTAGELLFLSPLIDLFNGEVISYQIDTNQNMPMVLTMLQDALPLVRPGVTILHSDRGWQYQPAGFRQVLRAHSITQSMSREGNCYDNACAENFLSHFKQELLRGRTCSSVSDFTASSPPGSIGSTPRASAPAETG